MKKHYMIIIKLLIVVFVIIGAYSVYKAEKKVLILHSYNVDYNWVQQQDIGSSRVLKNYQNITVRHHYMNLKNFIDDQSKKREQEIALNIINNWHPNVIIIADDIAQKLVGSKFVNHHTISIVFCAVNGEVTDYGYDNAENVTGIFERKPLFAIKEALMMLSNNKKLSNANIVFVCDASDSVTAELPQFDKFDWKPLIWHSPLRASNFNIWKKQILKANEYADFILVSDYREFKTSDGHKENILPIDIMAWTEEHSLVPIIGMSLINVFDGGALSVFNSGYEQGSVAASMAVEIINGVKAKDIPKQYTQRFLTSIRKSALGQRDLEVSNIFIELSKSSDGEIE